VGRRVRQYFKGQKLNKLWEVGFDAVSGVFLLLGFGFLKNEFCYMAIEFLVSNRARRCSVADELRDNG
jgi:hypothetical protein